MKTVKFYSGTSGLVLPVRRSLYPASFRDKSRLNYYSSLFNSVEINSSFYKTPMASTVSKWAAEVPGGFRFTFKLSKTITHSKELAFDLRDVNHFMQVIDHIGDKKGCLLIQFPPNLKIEKIKQLKKLLAKIQKLNGGHLWKQAIEFRNLSWYHKDTYDLLAQYETAMVIHDLPASAPPMVISNADFMYLRFHGPGGRYRGSYDSNFLSAHAQQIKTWIGQGKTVYVYFNNTMGDAVRNLMTLNGFLV